MKRRLDDYLERHPVALAAIAFAFIGAAAALDGERLLQASGADGRAVYRPLALGLVGALLTICWLRWHVRRSGDSRVADVAFLIWLGICLVAFVVAHPRRFDRYALPDPLQMFLVAYFFGLELAGVVVVPVRFWRMRRHRAGREHQPADLVEVWRVRDKASRTKCGYSYFVARCECGWVGTAHDTAHDEPDHEAESSAFAEAHRHGARVAPDVSVPLD